MGRMGLQGFKVLYAVDFFADYRCIGEHFHEIMDFRLRFVSEIRFSQITVSTPKNLANTEYRNIVRPPEILTYKK